MGTTCTAIAIRDNRLWLAHVGDSRAYLLRDGVLEQLSDDQTLHAQLILDGVMTPAAAERSPGGNVILQALGTQKEISPTIWAEGLPLHRGDIVVLCSDGLYELVNNDDIVRIISGRDPQEFCHELIESALGAGGYDNISAGVFCIVETEPIKTNNQAATKSIRPSKPTRMRALL
jgi:serine/threonine protein phosphatase PrpC